MKTFSVVAMLLCPPILGAQTVPALSPELFGAWRMRDGGLVAFYPTDHSDTAWRFVDFRSGAGHRLYPRGQMVFVSSDKWGGAEPSLNTYTFTNDRAGSPSKITIKRAGAPPRTGIRVTVREDTASFESGGVRLFGKLVRPANGRGPWPVVVFVHGSDNTGSVDREYDPYLLAANGVAMFVFDKRGTGRSGGQYTQLFSVLSDDVVAATRWVRHQPGIDSLHIGLAGFSQGGWVAPLAALKEPRIRFVLVGYGMAMSVADEDRYEAPLKLRERGFSDKDIAEFQELNSALHLAAEGHFKDWTQVEAKLAEYSDTPWMKALPSVQTWAGSFTAMGIENAKTVVPKMFETYFEPFYDPVPTLEHLQIPMLWLMAGDDIEAPPGPTIAVLARLRKQGKPFETLIFPHTDHGILEFSLDGTHRTRTRYAPDYFPTMVKWIVQQAHK